MFIRFNPDELRCTSWAIMLIKSSIHKYPEITYNLHVAYIFFFLYISLDNRGHGIDNTGKP